MTSHLRIMLIYVGVIHDRTCFHHVTHSLFSIHDSFFHGLLDSNNKMPQSLDRQN